MPDPTTVVHAAVSERSANLALSLPCPSCLQAMVPRVLECTACALRVEGSFRTNEFALLEDDYLQLLRVFLVCEGRIRDMEKALGISYPTVKTRLAALRSRLGLGDERAVTDGPNGAGEAVGDPPAADSKAAGGAARKNDSAAEKAPAAMAVLDLLGSGAIDHAEAVRRLRDG